MAIRSCSPGRRHGNMFLLTSIAFHGGIMGRHTAALTFSTTPLESTIKSLVSQGLSLQALSSCKQELQINGAFFLSNTFLLPSLLKACASSHSLHFTLQLHCHTLKTASCSDAVVSNSLLSTYAKFLMADSARLVFDTMPHRDSISWNSMVNCYAQNRRLLQALELLREMRASGFLPKPELSAAVVSLCGKTSSFRIARQIHAQAVVDGSIGDSAFILKTAFLDFYFKCDDSVMALRVFDQMEEPNEVSWTALISGFAINGNYIAAMDCYRAMQLRGIEPNRVTMITILPICAELGFELNGKEIHAYAFRHGFDSDHRFSAAIVYMYGKCNNDVHSAVAAFENSTVKDLVMWSSIIGSVSRSKDVIKAMILLSRMREVEIKPNSITLLPIIAACTATSSFYLGHGVHGHALKTSLNSDISIGNALIDMYAKCGFLADSLRVFEEMAVKDFVSWTTLINCYGLHGYANEAVQLFYKMKSEGIPADSIAYLVALSACSHGGMVEQGESILGQLLSGNNETITQQHYACYIDLLGKAGKVEDACETVKAIVTKPNPRIWSSLASACKNQARLEMAEMLAAEVIEMEPCNPANYTFLRLVYAETGNWGGAEKMKIDMRNRGVTKDYGFSQIVH